MTNVELIAHFLTFFIPSLMLFGAIYFWTTRWYEIQMKKKTVSEIENTSPVPEHQSHNSTVFFPLQIDAVQRLVLFLERISPNNMVMRLLNAGMPARAFQQKLLDNIRSEFEHNLAQQVYISSEAWEVVTLSKEEVVKIVNMAATKLQDTSTASDLAQRIFEITATLKSQPTDKAIELLKKELRAAI